MEFQVKLAAALPKSADANGLSDEYETQKLYHQKIRTGSTEPRVALVVFDVAEAARTKDGGGKVTHEIRWVEPITSDDGRRLAEKMLPDANLLRTGALVLPHELASLLRDTFADLPRSDEETDQMEERERESMTAADELRRHLAVVHGMEGTATLTETEAEEKHRADHDGGELGPLDHDRTWIGWTRADREVAEFQADEQGDEDSAALADNDGAIPYEVMADEQEAAAGGPYEGDGQ